MGKKQVATPQWDKSGPKFGTQKYFTVQQEQGGTVMSMSANDGLDTENASAVEWVCPVYNVYNVYDLLLFMVQLRTWAAH